MDKIRVFIRTLGCPKNEVDSLFIAGELAKAGIEVVGKLSVADVVLLNTCGFLEDARLESLEELNFFIGLKQTGLLKKVVVTGCYAQRSAKWFVKTFPEVDAVVGNRDLTVISSVVKRIFSGESRIVELPSSYSYWYSDETFLPLTYPFAYLKISEGCSNACSYCILPHIRGPARSLPMENIIRQARHLLDLGFKELILVAQDTAAYGLDIYKEHKLPMLVREILSIQKHFWLRLLYANPMGFPRELLDIMNEDNRFVHYIDLPIQHVSDNILKRMNRDITADEQRRLIEYMKEKVPDIAIRTTLLVGFPGEKDSDFSELINFIEQGWFDHIGVFAYSREPGTLSYDMNEQVPKDVAEERQNIVMLVAEENARKKMKALVGKTFPVLVETENRSHMLEGRLPYDAPEIDRIVVMKGTNLTDKFVNVKVKGFRDFSIYAEIIDQDKTTKDYPEQLTE